MRNQQLREEWLEKRAEDLERRESHSPTIAYKEGDPDAVTAYYRIHFKPALMRPEDYEKIIARLRSSFTKEGILKPRAIEARLMNDTWSSADYDLLPKLKSLRIPTLVISVDHEFIPASTAEHITQAIPNARMATLKVCGHFTYLECPVAVHEHIDAFLASRMKPRVEIRGNFREPRRRLGTTDEWARGRFLEVEGMLRDASAILKWDMIRRVLLSLTQPRSAQPAAHHPVNSRLEGMPMKVAAGFNGRCGPFCLRPHQRYGIGLTSCVAGLFLNW